MRPTVRDMTADDESGVAEVDRLATADLRKVYCPTEEALRHRIAMEASLRRLVAISDGRVVGTVQYRIADDHLFVVGLGVHPGYRRQGVARAVMDHLDRIARHPQKRMTTLRCVHQR